MCARGYPSQCPARSTISSSLRLGHYVVSRRTRPIILGHGRGACAHWSTARDARTHLLRKVRMVSRGVACDLESWRGLYSLGSKPSRGTTEGDHQADGCLHYCDDSKARAALQ